MCRARISRFRGASVPPHNIIWGGFVCFGSRISIKLHIGSCFCSCVPFPDSRKILHSGILWKDVPLPLLPLPLLPLPLLSLSLLPLPLLLNIMLYLITTPAVFKYNAVFNHSPAVFNYNAVFNQSRQHLIIILYLITVPAVFNHNAVFNNSPYSI